MTTALSLTRVRLVPLLAVAVIATGVPSVPATAAPSPLAPAAVVRSTPPGKTAVAVGTGGAIATVDLDASRAGLGVLRAGGNAVDAAVAAAATLGVTEPFSAGIGGGGYFVVWDPSTRRTTVIDGRETAPAAFGQDALTENGKAIPFREAVTSGLSVGVPGTPATWDTALRRFGTYSLAQALAPAIRQARNGFRVDQTFSDQVAANAARFASFTSTRDLYLPHAAPPAVGTTFRNPDLANTYAELARNGMQLLYRGRLGEALVNAAQHPPVTSDPGRVVRPGRITRADLAAYRVQLRRPTRVTYRGLEVQAASPSTSGGTTVGEALRILAGVNLRGMSEVQYQHHLLEATRLAFADRNRYVGDPAFVPVPATQLLSAGYGRERSCLIRADRTLVSPVPPGNPDGTYGDCSAPGGTASADTPQGTDTTHLTVVDRDGMVVSYTLTIEQTGGSGIVVPGRGFLLNNELTDFDALPVTPGVVDPNLPAPGKRPRSSISPTIVFASGRPVLALGSPGGATIITTVLQVLSEVVDRGLPLPAAIAAPRASQRNAATGDAEPAYLDAVGAELAALGQQLAVPTAGPEIGAATGIRLLSGGRLQAAAEPVRRGGGSALVVTPTRR